MEEQKQAIKILKKTNPSFQDMRQIVLKVRNNALSLADAVVEFGVSLIRKKSAALHDEQFIVLEELFHAALDLQLVHIASKCLKRLQNTFPDSPKIQFMQTLFVEAVGDNDALPNQVAENLSKNLADYDSKKRLIAQTRHLPTDGNQASFVAKMNVYLEDNPNDGEAWLELADFYLETLNYSRALFCYEELVLLYPKKYMYMMRIAEIYNTLGTEQDLLSARSYYSFVLTRMSNNYRSLWGLIQTAKKLKVLRPDDAKNEDILKTSILALKSFYKEKGQSHLIDTLNL